MNENPSAPPGVVRVCMCEEAERNRRRGERGDSHFVPVPVVEDEDGGVTCVFCWDLLNEEAVICMGCGRSGTHRVCNECFKRDFPSEQSDEAQPQGSGSEVGFDQGESK